MKESKNLKFDELTVEQADSMTDDELYAISKSNMYTLRSKQKARGALKRRESSKRMEYAIHLFKERGAMHRDISHSTGVNYNSLRKELAKRGLIDCPRYSEKSDTYPNRLWMKKWNSDLKIEQEMFTKICPEY